MIFSTYLMNFVFNFQAKSRNEKEKIQQLEKQIRELKGKVK